MKSPINLSIQQLTSHENITQTLIKNALKENNFTIPVKVVDVDITKLTVNVTPLILTESTNGTVIETNIIYNVKYVRVQSGKSAIIIDPTIGDIGIALICDRDISTIKETKKAATPASGRIHSLSDSVYLGGFLNQPPNQYVKFTTDGIEIYSPTQITAIAPNITANCDELNANVLNDTKIKSGTVDIKAETLISISSPQIALNGSITAKPLNGSGTATINMPIESTEEITSKGIALSIHKHSGVQTGDSETGEPK